MRRPYKKTGRQHGWPNCSKCFTAVSMTGTGTKCVREPDENHNRKERTFWRERGHCGTELRGLSRDSCLSEMEVINLLLGTLPCTLYGLSEQEHEPRTKRTEAERPSPSFPLGMSWERQSGWAQMRWVRGRRYESQVRNSQEGHC